jgi:uncharacterized protein YjbJ (UPF0337 family)
MNWDRVEGQWKQRRGKAVHHWGKVMNDELAAIAGKYEELVGRLQEKFGIAKDAAREQIEEYKKSVDHLKKSNGKLMRLQKTLSKKRKKPNGLPLKKRTSSRRPHLSRASVGSSSQKKLFIR